MSSVKIQGSATGTANFTIAVPDGTSTDRTINLPDAAGSFVLADSSGDVTITGAFTSQGIDDNATSTAMTLDASGNLLVGNTSYNSANTGVLASANGVLYATADGGEAAAFNRKTSDGTIASFRKDNTIAGTISTGTGSDLFRVLGALNYFDCGVGNTGLRFYEGLNAIYPINTDTSSGRDNAIDLGLSSTRFDDIFATNGTIQTSDANEKQDIAELNEAEKRVATAAKGLIRKFRWISSVEEKGDDARIHVGVIAQDLKAAFEAEGLDPGRYAMFISSTWWEADETYTDDEGVEQTRTNIYETAEEAPAGAVERTRLGVRYNQLLAFIIGAM